MGYRELKAGGGAWLDKAFWEMDLGTSVIGNVLVFEGPYDIGWRLSLTAV